MVFKTRFRNTKDEWVNAFGFMDGKPESWARGAGVKSLDLVYETDSMAIKEIVPPPIKFVGGDIGLAVISFSHDPGGEFLEAPLARNLRPEFEVVLLVGPCECKGATGFYSPAMWAQYDDQLIAGREFHGCPKKIAQFRLERWKDRVYASATRLDIKFCDIRCKLTGKKEVSPADDFGRAEKKDGYTFLLKVMPSTRNGDLDLCKILKMESVSKPGETYEVDLRSVELTFQNSAYDPLIDIPVEKIISCEYSENNDVAFHAHDLAECDPEIVKEYILYRYK
jgi:acetoacetate decarboxylase